MTTIVAVTDGKRVHIGSDSQATAGMRKHSIAGGKIIAVGDYTLGVAGLYDLMARLKRTEFPAVTGDIDAHVHDTLIPFLLEQQSILLTEFEVPEEQQHQYASQILLALRGRVYEIALVKGVSPLQETTGRYAIGSGTTYAIGALGAAKKNTAAAVLTALQAAAKHDAGTSGPFVVKTVR